MYKCKSGCSLFICIKAVVTRKKNAEVIFNIIFLAIKYNKNGIFMECSGESTGFMANMQTKTDREREQPLSLELNELSNQI